jgi:hypothetical protein
MNFIVAENIRDEEGRLVESALRAPALLDLSALRDVVAHHSSGWVVVERARLDHAATIPIDVARFIESQFHLHDVPDASDMAVFSWGERHTGASGPRAATF